jgi:hypothetical protein
MDQDTHIRHAKPNHFTVSGLTGIYGPKYNSQIPSFNEAQSSRVWQARPGKHLDAYLREIHAAVNHLAKSTERLANLREDNKQEWNDAMGYLGVQIGGCLSWKSLRVTLLWRYASC